MTYKLNPIIEKIESPIHLILPGGLQRNYKSGTATCSDTFDRNYVIGKITAEGSTVVIELVESQTAGSSWVGEEQTFF